MKRHTITLADLDEWLRTPQWRRFASSFSSGSNKGLEVDASPTGRWNGRRFGSRSILLQAGKSEK